MFDTLFQLKKKYFIYIVVLCLLKDVFFNKASLNLSEKESLVT